MKFFKRKILLLFLLLFTINLSSCEFNIINPFYSNQNETQDNIESEDDNSSDNTNDSIDSNNSNQEQNNTNENESNNDNSNDLENESNNDNSNDLENESNNDNSNDLENESNNNNSNGSTLEENDDTSYNVHFILNNGDEDVVISVVGNTDELIGKPDNPTKEGFIFDCWCSDLDLTEEYDFSKEIVEETYIYAKYVVDYKYLTNKITTEIMSSNITVINTKYYNSSVSTGSGIIFKKEASGSNYKYYLLTNNHVVSNTQTNYEYSLEDYQGNTFNRSNNSVTLIGSSADYDLAVLSFVTDKTYHVIELDNQDPAIGTEVIALGQPLGQTNSITYGNITKYATVTTNSDDSKVTFNVIHHDAYINSGSSGGALLNTDLKLVAINFAGYTSNGEFISGAAIQISKVIEYLNLLSITI